MGRIGGVEPEETAGPPGAGRRPELQPSLPATCWTLQAPGLGACGVALPGFSQARLCTERVGIDRGSPAWTEAPPGTDVGSKRQTPIFLDGILRPESFRHVAKVGAGARMRVALPPSSLPFPLPQFA